MAKAIHRAFVTRATGGRPGVPPLVVDMPFVRLANRLPDRDAVCDVLRQLPERSFAFARGDTMRDLDAQAMLLCLEKGYIPKPEDIQSALGVWEGERVLRALLPRMEPDDAVMRSAALAVSRAMENNDRKCERVLRDFVESHRGRGARRRYRGTRAGRRIRQA